MSENFSIPTPGDVIAGKYRVMEELGRGAYGVVFRAEQIGLGRSVALKTLLPAAFLQLDIVQRFHREAQLISTLDHENIIKLYDYGMDESLLYMAVEYVEGRTLGDLIKEEAPLEAEKVHEVMGQLLSALDYAHEHGIVHRDLKPDNILLLKSRPEEGVAEEVVKVLDFGIAKLVRGDQENNNPLKTLTQDGTVLGTPHYMSPENIVGDSVDHKTDLYAVGIILYEMLTGTHPFEAQSPSAVMVRHLKDDAPHLPEPWTHSAFDHAVQRCLEKQPFDRVETAGEVLELLKSEPPKKVQRAKSTDSQIYDRTTQETAEKKQRLLLAVLAILGILLVSIGWKLWTVQSSIRAEEEVVVAPPQVVEVQPEVAPKPPEADQGLHKISELENPDAGTETPGFEFEDVEPTEPTEPTEPEGVAVETKTPKPREKTEQAPKVAEKAETVKISLMTNPSNASVTFDGVPVGNSPVERQVPKSDDEITVRISLLGYKNEVVKIAPQADVSREIKLQFDRIKMFD